MQHLRIVGVNDEENVPQLILSDESGQEFALPMDGALRHAATRPPVRPAKASPGRSPLTPREIQARLRAGATVDQVVAASGLTTAHVDRYAGPVHAEREYMAQQARGTQVAPASAAEAHRRAFGDEPANLEAMVKVRLRAMEVDLSSLSWDSWRREDGLWQVTCVFDVDSSATHGAGIGLRPPAEWTFQPETRHLRAVNRWAEALSALSTSVPTPGSSETDPQTSAAGPGRRLSAVDSVFNVEDSNDPRGLGATSAADSGAAGRRQPESSTRGSRDSAPRPQTPTRGDAASRGEGHEHEDLLDVLRARRGQRLGADAEADDRLALMLNRQDPQDRDSSAASSDRSPAPAGQDDEEHSTVPIPRLRPVQNAPASDDAAQDEGVDAPAPEVRGATAAESSAGTADATERATGDRSADAAGSDGEGTGATGSGAAPNDGRLDAWGFAYEGESEERGGAAGQAPAPPAEDAEPTEPDAVAEKPRKRAPARRASMPKWDDILFGSKND
ncbi:DUF3071 domain-containing protein [Nesterenkonia sp. AY15]|uniref:septation protein SepH n=1 Tax=Nesterenkonia sp. AY15 TaxID=2901139 RepID=UPI001F4CA9D9|nr:septation protein SepH [Nesterenkonia sp. AY15]MCH8571252.1 DUF3071 domain-containing protein [Nesterenkonia sp. AY15]